MTKTFFFWGKVRSGIKLENKREFAKALKQLEGKDIELIIKQWLKRRTLNQNAYYWTIVRLIGDHTGFTAEEVHELMKRKFLSYEKQHKNKIYRFTKSTTDLNIGEFIEYVEKVKQFAIEELDIIPPEINGNEQNNSG